MTNAKPLPVQMLDLINGYWVSKMVHVAAEMGLADALGDRARTAAEVAGEVGADPERLHRMMRALTGVGVFSVDGDGRYANTELGATLRSDRPDSMRDFARMMPASYNWHGWDALDVGIREQRTPFDEVFGMGGFAYLQQHPDDEAVFARAMASISGAENPAVAAALPLDGIGSLMDVGGSGGHLLAAVMQQHAALRGVLFDQPQVVHGAKQAGYLQGLGERVAFAGGDFFEAVPGGVDAYLMKYILHDWDDDRCVRILQNCRANLSADGRVFVVDNVVVEGNEPSWGKLLDVNMLVLTGGKERTEAEFAALFARAGLRLDRVLATECPLGIVVGVPA
ncbi:MAG: methyltransferase [Planctomycetota bacterium]